MPPLDANQLLALPAGVPPRGRRWLAAQLASSLCARVGYPERGPVAGFLRELLGEAWARGESPSLDDLLGRALAGADRPGHDAMPGRLVVALRFVEAAPEFGGGSAHPVFAQRALAARAAAVLA